MAENQQGGNVYERVCEIFKIPCLYPEQIDAIEVSLPTRYGKSMIYYALPIVYDHANVANTASKVVIISPLQSLMEDQVRYLKSVGLTAIALHEKREDDLKKSKKVDTRICLLLQRKC